MSDTIQSSTCLHQSGPAATDRPTTPAARSALKRRPPREILLPQIVELALEGHSHYAISRSSGVPRRTVDRWLARQRRAWAKAGEQTQESESQEYGGGDAHQVEENTEEKLDFAPNRPLEAPAAAAQAREKEREGDPQNALLAKAA